MEIISPVRSFAFLSFPCLSFRNLMRVSRNAGGEDGAVKLLDVFLDRHRRSSNASSQAATDPPSEAFHRPYAEVVQTLPSHESSVGALAVGLYGCSNGLESTLVVSGGGKMEVRAWRMGGGCGHGGSGEGRPREEAMGAACAPLVRFTKSFWGPALYGYIL